MHILQQVMKNNSSNANKAIQLKKHIQSLESLKVRKIQDFVQHAKNM